MKRIGIQIFTVVVAILIYTAMSPTIDEYFEYNYKYGSDRSLGDKVYSFVCLKRIIPCNKVEKVDFDSAVLCIPKSYILEGEAERIRKDAIRLGFTEEKVSNEIGSDDTSLYVLIPAREIFEHIPALESEPDDYGRADSKFKDIKIYINNNKERISHTVQKNWNMNLKNIADQIISEKVIYTEVEGTPYHAVKGKLFGDERTGLQTYELVQDKPSPEDIKTLSPYELVKASCSSWLEFERDDRFGLNCTIERIHREFVYSYSVDSHEKANLKYLKEINGLIREYLNSWQDRCNG